MPTFYFIHGQLVPLYTSLTAAMELTKFCLNAKNIKNEKVTSQFNTFSNLFLIAQHSLRYPHCEGILICAQMNCKWNGIR